MSKLVLRRRQPSSPSTEAGLSPLTSEELDRAREDMLRLAREDFAFYCEVTHRRRFRMARHIELICQVLEKIERGEITRAMFFLPPRHSKSMTVTETFPSWFIGRNPDRKVIEVSYSDDFAKKFGRENLKKITAYGKKVFGIVPDPKLQSSSKWGVGVIEDGKFVSRAGQMISSGIGGGITGEGADLLLIDDPIKNAEEANSATYRENLWNEWNNTLQTRLQAGGSIIIILTRWHEDDLAGRILNSEDGKNWTVINLPAEAEENDVLGRQIGDALWPEGGYDEEWARVKKVQVGPYTWASLYQQRPAPPEGELLKKNWWRYYNWDPHHQMGKFDELVQTWDMAFKDTKESARVSGQVWGRIGANCYLCDEDTALMDFPQSVMAVRKMTAKWPKALKKYVEERANGAAIIAVLKNKIPGLIPVEPEGGKVARAYAITGILEAGNVYLPTPELAPRITPGWVIGDFVQECSAFPRGKYKDRVDAMTQALGKWVMVRPRDPSKEVKIDEAVVSDEIAPDGSRVEYFDFGNDDELENLFG